MKKTFKIIGLLALAGVVGAILMYQFVYNKPHPDYEKEVALYTLPAEEIFQEFESNPKEANSKYTGKMIQVTGELDKVEQTDSLTIGVFVLSEGMFGDEGIRCTMLPKYAKQLKGVKLPIDIRIKGLCTGYNDTDIIMEHCSMK